MRRPCPGTRAGTLGVMSEEQETSSPAQPRRLVIEAGEVGLRLQQVLTRRLGLSLSQANRLLDRGSVQVDHWIARRKHKGYKVGVRQVVKVAPFTPAGELRAIENREMAVEILAADEERGWVVVNKPAGVPVHPLEETETRTVLNAMIARHPLMQGVGEGGLRSGVVHRLDVETSGTLLLATKQEAWVRMRQAFAGHRALKRYRAIVLGELQGEGEERMPLNIARHKPAMVRVVNEELPEDEWPAGTRWCDLRWKSVAVFRGASLIEVELGTGFLHQIRVMFSQMAHPVAGDGRYGRDDMPDATGAARPMLHACELRVEEAGAVCEPPVDFVAVMEKMGGRQVPSFEFRVPS